RRSARWSGIDALPNPVAVPLHLLAQGASGLRSCGLGDQLRGPRLAMNKTIEDEAALIAELNAVFPRSDAQSLRKWRNRATSIGAVVCGEAKIGGEEIGPTVVVDHETYNGWVHKAFEAWCEDRGWYVEVYEPG